MTVTFLKNGTYQMVVSGGDAIDTAILEKMAKLAADNPAAISMTCVDGVATVAVAQR